MGASPETFLVRLEPGVEIAAGKIRGLASAAPALEADGLVATRKVGRALHVVLTEAGVARRAALAAAAPAPRPRTSKPRESKPRAPSAASRLTALEASVAELAARVAALAERAAGQAELTARLAALDTQSAELTARLAAIESQVDATAGAAVTVVDAVDAGASPGGGDAVAVGAPPLDPDDVKAAVLAAVGELDHRGRYGGLVPIPELRAELRGQGIADDQAVTRALEALEHDWTVDLLVAQSPTQVPHRAAGIERPGRGLLYYVARR